MTSDPTSRTRPTISWPGVTGYSALPHSLRAWWMSEWQMPANSISMSTSAGPVSRRRIVVFSSGASGAVAVTAATSM